MFDIRSVRDRNGYCAPSPADDLFALGVTAYRLIMGQSPPAMDAQQDEEGSWRVTSPDPRPLLENNPPEARVPAVTGESPARPGALSLGRAWKPWLAWAAVAAVALMPWSRPPHVAVSPGDISESTAAVGDSAPTEPGHSNPPPSQPQSLSQDSPSLPDPTQPRRQLQPYAKGRCPMPKQVALNGGCWVELSSMPTEECVGSGYMLLKGKCYAPALDVPRKAVPTSNPGTAR